MEEEGIRYMEPAEGEKKNLDCVIGLRVENATVLEALSAQEEAVNANPLAGSYLCI